MTLVMMVDALREMQVEKIRLTMPYIPYARQDRVCNAGEAFSIRAFARIINALEFASVVVYDAHSEVSVALIERCINLPRYQLMRTFTPFLYAMERDDSPWYLVSPDAGAVKKSYDTVKELPLFKGIIFAEKVRDPATGKILKTVVNNLPDDIADAKLLISDDICDGGRTFIELAKVLPKCKELDLFVTHGIFSAGMEVLTEHFDNVWAVVNFKDCS
jgi:ribose-phosphate pyrophosphokinase